MKEGGAGISARVYSTGIIANYNCMGVDPSPSLLQHVKKISGTSGKIISLK